MDSPDARSPLARQLRLLDLLQVVDRSFPTGAFVHSGGLEWLVTQEAFDLEATLRLKLREQLARLELVFVLQSYTVPPEQLDEEYHARLMAREAREASALVGRRLLVNACGLFHDANLEAFAASASHAHQPVAFGLVARALDLSPEFAGLAYAFQALRGQVSAAQRLIRLGQTAAQQLLHGLKPAMEEAVAVASATPLASAGGFCPVLEVAAMAHERQAVRLFVS